MARFNEILVGRYNRLLQKLFQIKATAPVPVLATEIQPQISVFNGVENRYLEGWNRYGRSFAQSAVALQTIGLQLRNPAGSNVIAVVEKIIFNAAADIRVVVGFLSDNLDLASILTGTALDLRNIAGPVIIASQAAGSPLSGNELLRSVVLANTEREIISTENQEITLLPGQTLRITTQTVNIAMDGGCLWRERFLEESERT